MTKKITISGDWQDVHSAVTMLMREGFHISRFDHIQAKEVKVELYDSTRTKHTDMQEVREQVA